MADIKKFKKLLKQYQEAKGYADGGEIQSDDSDNPFLNVIKKMGQSFSGSKPSPTPSQDDSSDLDKKYAKIRAQQQADRSQTAQDYYSEGGKVPQYADGGEVEDSDKEDKPGLSPEEFEKHLEDLKKKGYELHDVDGDEQTITVKPSKPVPDEDEQPASEQDLTDENPDDKALESQMGNEDLQAQMEADKGDEESPENPQQSQQPSQDQDDEDEERMVASQDQKPEDGQEQPQDQGDEEQAPMSNLQKMLAKAQSERKAAMLADQMSRADALLAAGIAGHGATPAPVAYVESKGMANLPVQNLQEQLSLQKEDPQSQVSQVVRSYLQNKGLQVPKNASASDLFTVAPFLAKDQTLQVQMQKALMGIQARAQQGDLNRQAAMERTQQQGKNIENAAKIRADAMKQMTDQRQTMQGQRLSGQLVQRVNNDPVVKPSLQNVASLEKSKRLIENTDVPLTPQLLSDAEQDIASGMQIRGMGGSEGKINRTTLDTIGRELQKKIQFYANKPDVDLRKSDPDLVNTIYKMNSALLDDYQNTIQARKQALAEEYRPMAGDNPQINKAIDQYVNSRPVSAKGLHAPGSTVMYKGKQYTVGADGNTLTPVGG